MTASPTSVSLTRPRPRARGLAASLAPVAGLLIVPVVGGAFLLGSIGANDLQAQGSPWPVLPAIVTLAGCAIGAVAFLGRWHEKLRSREGLEAERAQAWLHELIARSLNELYVFDPETLFFRFANRGACRNVGYAHEELTSRTPLDLAPHLTDQGLRALLASLRGGEKPVVFETVHRRKDGSEYPVEVHLQLVETGDRELGLAIVDDITGRRRLEAQLARIQKMEALGQLGAGIAHDFNNILTTAGGYAQLVREQVPIGDPIRGDLDQIVAATERGAALVRQILAFSRRSVLEPRVVDLNGLIEGLGPMLARLLGEDVDLTLTLDSQLGHLKGDPGQVEQVIINLAVNARDAMPDGGQLSITTANVELDDAYAGCHSGVVPGPYVQLAVSDTGAGMDAATLEHMFEPFFTTKGPDRGTGLGLATVHGIVNQSGGHVWAYSEPGHGTSFKVYFPRVDEHAAPFVARRSGDGAGTGSETIWLVEDDETVRVVATRGLERLGYRVIAIATPADALERLAGDAPPIDVLVTDVIMPGMEGPELVRRLDDRLPGLRVLFVSGYAEQRFALTGPDGAERPFLPKPYSLEDLARAIRTLLDGGAR